MDIESSKNNHASLSCKVSPNDVWGDKQRIIEIVGLGSGSGFTLKHANLPIEWEDSMHNLLAISPEGFAKFTNDVFCKERGYELEKMSLDPCQVLTELAIKNTFDGSVSSIHLAEQFPKQGKGEYISKNIRSIGAAAILHATLSRYLRQGWGDDFDYAYFDGNDVGTSNPGYSCVDLAIPKKIYDFDKEFMNRTQQEDFKLKASNIAGRFGKNLRDLDFDDRGILRKAHIEEGDQAFYSLNGSAGVYTNEYYANNVDNAYVASALHGIVAHYVNYLLDKYPPETL